jgi:hypothetical protein
MSTADTTVTFSGARMTGGRLTITWHGETVELEYGPDETNEQIVEGICLAFSEHVPAIRPFIKP